MNASLKILLGLILASGLCLVLYSVYLRDESLKQHPQWGSCFVGHLAEAIEVNLERREIYSRLSNGESDHVSDVLIWSEKLSFVVAYILELGAAWSWSAGIPILCADFVSMEHIQPIQKELMQESLVDAKPSNAFEIMQQLGQSYWMEGTQQTFEIADYYLQQMRVEQNSLHNCMLRHVLESTARLLWLRPQYLALAEEKKAFVFLTDLISSTSFYLHLSSFALAAWIDEMTADLRKKGLHIVCADVPHIDTRPNLLGQTTLN